MEEAKEAFSSSFKINSKVDTLTKVSQKSFQNYESVSNGQKSTYTILNKAIYDIYTLNSTTSPDEDKNFYNTKYTTAITVNGLCSKYTLNPEEDDCDIIPNLDLNKKEEKNLRRNQEEEDIDTLIKKAVLPICLVEHTDTNLILSLTCPETLSDSFRNDIIKAFNNIKPETINGFKIDTTYMDTKIKEENNKIYISSFDNVCSEPNLDPLKKLLCNSTKDIITDKEGNLISINFMNSTKIINDENNILFNNFSYSFKNIPKEESKDFNEEIYKTNLEKIISLIYPIMKKNIYIENITNYAMDITIVQENTEKRTLRNLIEASTEDPGVYRENIFNKQINTLNITFDVKNDIGLGESQSAKAISIYDINNDNYKELSNSKIKTNLNNTLDKYVHLLKSGNKLVENLYGELNGPFLNFRDIINENFEKLNKILANKDLSEIFDSTLSISEINSLPYSFVAATDNLYKSINEIRNNILYSINDARNKLKEDISKYLTNSHNLMFKIFNNLSDITNALSSDQSKIAKVSSYYLNNTDISYNEIIKNAKKVLDNYYKDEKNTVLPLVNELLGTFYNDTNTLIKKYQKKLDIISDRLNSEEIVIALGEKDDYKNCINNIYNSKTKLKEIIDTIKSKFEESLNLKSNGYFESKKEIEENDLSYGKTSEKAQNISYTLDNNEFIDKAFDDEMKIFRDKFIELIKYMENSIKDKFPLEENILSSTLFNATYLNGIDEFFQTEKIKILKFIKEENDKYLNSINDILTNFKSDNSHNLDQIMSEIISLLNYNYLDNLDIAYHDSLDFTFKSINNIIENNKKLGEKYLNEVKNANSLHITAGFINKYNIYINSFNRIKGYINNNLKIDLTNKYKNVINQVRGYLQSIKSNKILEKYYKQLPLAEKHMNSIKGLFDIFNKYISDENFNKKYLSSINVYITIENNIINKIIKDFKSIYGIIAKKSSYNANVDYTVQKYHEGYYYCCSYSGNRCRRNCYQKPYYYTAGINVASTNNHLNLKELNFSEYIKNFDQSYNEIYPQFSNNISIYDNLLSEFDMMIDSKKNDYIKEEISYLDNISKKIKSIIEEKLGNNLLIASYNYYKNKIQNTLPKELTNNLEQWATAYDQLYDSINTNKNNFKSSVYEFAYLATFYLATYKQNISYDYSETIVDKLKNDFNYTNQYYYNIILSKLNKTYSYILSNIPINEEPFDAVINKRINEINNSYYKLVSELQKSRNEILDKTKQEVILQVNPKNFFYINNIISNHTKVMNNTLNQKVANLSLLAFQIQKQNPIELMAARYYLENSINGKQIKDNYDMINKATFVDLQTSVYKRLIDDIWNIDRDEFIKSVINTLNILNENNNNNFQYEKEKYYEILENKLYTEFYTKDNLVQNINSYFIKGLNMSNINEEIKIQIDALLNNILTEIKKHITNETKRLGNELTSYSKDFTKIKNRLNNYKNTIYEEVYTSIIYPLKEFYEQIYDKIYNKFIKLGLNEFEKNIKETDFETAKFLNMSINLNEIINKKTILIISEYNNLTINQIEYLYRKYSNELDRLFSFSNMKLKINNEIDDIFQSTLLPILQKVAVYNSGDVGILDYDLPLLIINDTNNLINNSISKIKNIIEVMKGENYIINYKTPADFSAGKNNIYDKIKNLFKNFTISYSSQEKKEFEKIIGDKAVNNFNILINNFVPSFGVDFFNRILKFNEIQKIKRLYLNLKYSLAETIIYYISLANIYKGIYLPVDIKKKILTLNDLDSVVKSKNDYIISTLNDKLDSYFEETKNYITNKYIDDMNLNSDFDLKFNSNVKDKIKGLISGNLHNYENEYIKMMRENIKEPFIKEYTIILNEATEDMKEFIERSKVESKADLDSLFSLDSDTVLADIQNKLNYTKRAVEEYNSHLNTFKISNDVSKFLKGFGKDVIIPKYKDINDLLDERVIEIIANNLDTLSDNFKKEYKIENYINEINNINKNLSFYFDNFTKILNKYGSIEDIYEKNLDNEIINYRRMRLLEEENIPKKVNKKLSETFNNLNVSSSSLNDFIQSYKLFTEFDDKIKKYINEKNSQYLQTEINLGKNKEKNSNYELMIERLNDLNKLSLEYYSISNKTFNDIKEQLINNITKLVTLVNSCEKVTNSIINKKYITIKNEFNKINYLENLKKEKIEINPYNNQSKSEYFTLKTTIKNYLTDTNITLDILYEEDTEYPKVIGTVKNKINPKEFELDFYSLIGQYDRLGRIINVDFNNISSYINIIFDANDINYTLITNFDIKEYAIKTQYYKKTMTYIVKYVLGIPIYVPNVYITENIDTPEEEKYKEIKAKNITSTYYFCY